MPSIDSFRTARLVAERLRETDFGELCLMHHDPRVMATLGGVRTDEETRKFLDKSLDHWDRHGFGLWIFRDAADGRFVGRGGIRHVEIVGKDEVEVAYALRAEAWGKGLATEMARASLALAFDSFGLPEVVAFTLPTNKASQRIMQKLGFAYEREFDYEGHPQVLYRLPRSARSAEGDVAR